MSDDEYLIELSKQPRHVRGVRRVAIGRAVGRATMTAKVRNEIATRPTLLQDWYQTLPDVCVRSETMKQQQCGRTRLPALLHIKIDSCLDSTRRHQSPASNNPASVGPIRITQPAFSYLAGTGLRQLLLRKVDRFRDLVPSNPTATELNKLLLRGSGTVVEHDDCFNRLSPAIVRHADHRNLAN